MLTALPPLEAFQQDIASRRDDDGPDDATLGRWLEVAVRLDHAVRTSGAERERQLTRLLASERVTVMPRQPVSRETLVAAIVPVTEVVEEAAFLRLARSMVGALVQLISDGMIAARGRLLAQSARVARKLGEVNDARDLYQCTEALGLAHDLPELIARSWLGYSVLAQLRGDYPEARRRLRAVVDLPGATRELVMMAHQSLTVAAGAAADHETAAVHAWKAFELSETADERNHSLVNLAQVLLDAGYPRAALRGFAAVLAQQPAKRFLLPALGGAARAAVHGLQGPPAASLVRLFARRIDGVIASLGHGESLPYESAVALVEVSEALGRVRESAESQRAAAMVLVEANGYHELAFRLDNPPAIAAPAAVPAAPEMADVVAKVESLEGAELVAV